MKDFSSREFQDVLSRYEKSLREGTSCYLDSDDYVDLSDYYLDENQPEKALAVCDKGLLHHPDDDLMPVVRAGVLIYLHRFDEAESIVDSLDSADNYDVIYLQAQLEYALYQRPDVANAYFETWMGEVEDEWGFYDGRGFSKNTHDRPLYDEFDDEEEESVSEQDAEREVRDAYLHVIMSYVELGEQGREEYAQKWVKAYLDRFDTLGNFESDLAIADICRDEGYVELVELIFLRLLDTDPYLPNGWTILSAAQQTMEKYDEALNSLGFALAINPDDELALLTKAHSYYGLQNYAEALPVFLKYRRLTGAHSEDQYIAFCYACLNELELSVGYWKSAFSYVSKTKDLDSEQRAWKYFEVSDGLCMAQQFDLAAKAIERALAIDPKNIDYRLQQGTVLLGQGLAEQATDTFSSILEDNPQHYHSLLFAFAIRFLAYDYNNMAEVILHSLKDMELKEEDFPARNHVYAYLAMAQYQNGETSEALQSLKTACELTPELVGHMFRDLLPDTVLPQDYYEYLKTKLNRKR